LFQAIYDADKRVNDAHATHELFQDGSHETEKKCNHDFQFEPLNFTKFVNQENSEKIQFSTENGHKSWFFDAKKQRENSAPECNRAETDSRNNRYHKTGETGDRGK
jgi:hypothetical protein